MWNGTDYISIHTQILFRCVSRCWHHVVPFMSSYWHKFRNT
jgi:hypothetical protein